MSLLSRDIDSILTEKQVEAAEKAIKAASSRIKSVREAKNWEDRLAALTVPPRTPADIAGAFPYIEDIYACRDWDKLRFALESLEQSPFKKSADFVSRKLFASAMIAEPTSMSNLYAQISDHLALDPANGDLYLALGALKLAELNLVDCRLLLQLADKCPIVHPLMLNILQEKLDWSESAYNRSLLLIGQIFTRPNAVKQLIEKYPQHKHLSAEIESALVEWRAAPHLHRLRLAKTWMATPHMSDLMNLDLTFNVYTSSEASLLALPNTVLQRILEYSETAASLKLLRTTPLAYLRVSTSPAWVLFGSQVVGISKEEMGPDTHGNLGECIYNVLCAGFPLLSSLQAAESVNHIQTIERRQWASISMSDTYTPCTDHKTMALCFLLQIHMNYVRGLLSPLVIQHLVNSTRLHLSLARLTAEATESVSILIVMLLTMLLSCGAPDAPRWARSLKDAGYHHIVANGLSENAETAATPLSTLIEFHNYIDFPRTVNIFAQDELDTNARYEDADYMKKHFAGIWHVLWSFPYTWSERTKHPFYGTFQIDESTIRVQTDQPRNNRGDESDDEDDGGDGNFANPHPGLLEELTEDLVTIKMSGTGCVVTEEGQIVKTTFEASVLGFGGSEQVELTLKEMGIVVQGLAFQHGFGGQVYEDGIIDAEREGDDYDYSQQRPVAGGCLLWKSTATDTEENWIQEESELKELAASRTLEVEKDRGNNETEYLAKRTALRSLRYQLLHAERCMIALSSPISNVETSNMQVPVIDAAKLPQVLNFAPGPEMEMQRHIRQYTHIWFFNRARLLRLKIASVLIDKSFLSDLHVICQDMHQWMEGQIAPVAAKVRPEQTAVVERLARAREISAHWKALSHSFKQEHDKPSSKFDQSLQVPIEELLQLSVGGVERDIEAHAENPYKFAYFAHQEILGHLIPGSKKSIAYYHPEDATFWPAPKQTVLARLEQEQALSNDMADFNKVYEKWMARFGTCFPMYNSTDSPLTIDRLAIIIAGVLKMALVGQSADDLVLSHAPLEELEERLKPYQTSRSISITTALLLGGAVVAAAAIGGFVASRIWTRKQI